LKVRDHPDVRDRHPDFNASCNWERIESASVAMKGCERTIVTPLQLGKN
jgi:hypothetical protein